MSNPVPTIAQKAMYNSRFKTRCIKFFIHLIKHFDDRHLDPAISQILRHLQPDKSTATTTARL